MIQDPRNYNVQLAIVGTGLTGFAASIFALSKNLSIAQMGNTGAVAYTTGYFDLLGYHPADNQSVLSNPWSALEQLRKDEPEHPYSLLTNKEIKTAFTLFTKTISDMGIHYTKPGESNLMALSPAGTVKPTLSVPCTMRAGIEAHKKNAPTYIADISGLQGFSAKEMVANLKDSWSHVSATAISFPQMDDGRQVYAEVMARALQVAEHREEFARRIKAVAGNVEYLGLPAMLGIHEPDKVHADLEQLTGLKIFEIPTMPPSVSGIRLREMFEQTFPAQGITFIPQQKVSQITLSDSGGSLFMKDSYGDVKITADHILLASGRFLSGGLSADRNGIKETLLNLPVSQPESRDHWYQQHYFEPQGHPVNRAGVVVNEFFQPLDKQGEIIHKNLYAAGILLAHHDWTRQRCGAGIAISSAYKAVESITSRLKQNG